MEPILARLVKSFILVTIALTVILVMSPTGTATIPPDGTRGILWERNEFPVIFITLGSSLAFISLLLILFAVKGRSVRSASTQEVESLRYPTRSGEGNHHDIQNTIPPLADLHSLETNSALIKPHDKADSWKGESSLVGNTLRVYWSLLCRRHSSVGLREIQREIGFSSPSSAVYQLEKLMNLGLVEKNSMGDYIVGRVIKVGLLRGFFLIGGYPLPKCSIYGALTLLIDAVCFAILVGIQVQIPVASLASLPGLFSSSLFWYDAGKTLRYKQRLIEMNTIKRS